MKTICIATGRLDPTQRYPLVVAANRDEFNARQGEPARFRDGGPLDYVAPRDPRAGGTWFGLNRAGLVVLITNQPAQALRLSTPSRGFLVRNLLEQAHDLEEASTLVEEMDPAAYNPFSLVVLGPGGLVSVSRRETDGVQWRRFERGSFFLSNRKDFQYSRQGYSWQHLTSFNGSARPELQQGKLRDSLQRFCRSHDSFEYREAICQHGEEYGTLSSSIVVLDRDRREVTFDFSQGAPCQSTYESVAIPADFQSDFVGAWTESTRGSTPPPDRSPS